MTFTWDVGTFDSGATMDSILWHPRIVHLPIALAVIVPLVASGVLLAWWRDWLPARSWWIAVALQGLLVTTGFAAMQTGEADEERVEHLVPHDAVEAHEEAGEAFVWLGAGVFVLFALGGALPKRTLQLGFASAAVVGSLAGLAAGVSVGSKGGDLVYVHGAANAFTSSAPSGGSAPVGSAHDDDHDDDD